MADSTTPNYSLILVEVGGSTDTWGTKLNANATAIDAALAAAVLRDGSRSFTAKATFHTTGFDIGDFNISVNGTTLEFKYDGTLIAQLESDGTLTAVDVVADDSL